MKKLILSTIIFLCLVSFSWATTYTVGSGKDYETPALAAAGVPDNADHTIIVDAGTYAGFTDSRSGAGPGYRHWLAEGTTSNTYGGFGTVTITGSVFLRGDNIKFQGFTLNGVNPTNGNSVINIGNYVSDPGPDTGDNVWVTQCTIIDSYDTAVSTRGDNHIIERVEIDGMYADYDDGDCFRLWGHDNIVRQNYFHNVLSARVGTSHVDFVQCWEGATRPDRNLTDSVIERNLVFMGNSDTGYILEASSADESRYGFMIGGTLRLTIRNNIIMAWGGMNQGENGADPNTDLKVYNNTFITDETNFTNNYAGSGFSQYAGSTGAEVRNNIFIGFKYGPSEWTQERSATVIRLNNGAQSYTGTNNIFYVVSGVMSLEYPFTHLNLGEWQSTYSYETNSFIADPVFVDDYIGGSSVGNFNLTVDSPAKDVGYDLTGVVTDDFAGNSRPSGEGYDIGAYEYIGVGLPGDPGTIAGGGSGTIAGGGTGTIVGTEP